MRWNIGGYEVKYNPKQDDKNWSSVDNLITNINGNTSNPNLTYNGTHDFSIDIYEKPTYVDREPILSGTQYVSIAYERTYDKLYLLKSDSTFDIKGINGNDYGNKVITAGTGITLPATSPISIVHMDIQLGILYNNGIESCILITDKNGVANRKYIYSNTDDDVNNLSSISWDFNKTIYALNSFGKVYAINVDSGAYSFLYEYGDFEDNKSKKNKKYTSSLCVEKQGYRFFGALENKKDILLFDNETNAVTKIESNMGNIIDIAFSNFSDEYYIIIGNKIMKMSCNTCRLDVEIIKDIVSNGQVVISDELGIQTVISVDNIRISRQRNMQEAKYEVSFSGAIVYTNQSFDGKWIAPTRTIGV